MKNWLNRNFSTLKIFLLFLMFGLLAYFNNQFLTGLGGFGVYILLEVIHYYIKRPKRTLIR